VLLILGLGSSAVPWFWSDGSASPFSVHWLTDLALPAGAGFCAVAGGIILTFGGPRAMAWLHAASTCLLAGLATTIVAAALFQPWDLTLTEIRLSPKRDVALLLSVLIASIVPLVIVGTLGQTSVRDIVLRAGGRRIDPRLAIRIGVGLALLPATLLWLTLHGPSKALAEQLASRQFGPGYRYHLRWLGEERMGDRQAVTATVVAWNATDIRTVLIHWQDR
jgi:hypothetical protein